MSRGSTCSNWICLEQEVELDDLQRSFPTAGFCYSVTLRYIYYTQATSLK